MNEKYNELKMIIMISIKVTYYLYFVTVLNGKLFGLLSLARAYTFSFALAFAKCFLVLGNQVNLFYRIVINMDLYV